MPTDPVPPVRGNRFCPSCGGLIVEGGAGAKRCGQCGLEVFENPIPVVVGLVPVRVDRHTGLLVLRRGIEPGRGKLALPGGFLEIESWQAGLSRELQEETGLGVPADSWMPFGFASSAPRPNRLLVFATCPAIAADAIPVFVPHAEAAALGFVFRTEGLDTLMAFPLHMMQIRSWLAAHGGSGPAGFHEMAQASG